MYNCLFVCRPADSVHVEERLVWRLRRHGQHLLCQHGSESGPAQDTYSGNTILSLFVCEVKRC